MTTNIVTDTNVFAKSNSNDDDLIMCNYLVEQMKLEKNRDALRKCHFEFNIISKKFPPQKNEYKFIYGKLGEKALISMFQNIGINSLDLDMQHKIGSEYKNDIQMNNTRFSIKVKLNDKGDVIMINCKSKKDHNLDDINTIVVVINSGLIYVIPKTFNTDNYLKRDAGSISYRSKLFTHIKKNNPEYIYKFPDLLQEEIDKVNETIEVDIYNQIFDEHIKQ
jgi:hypothetical protein